MLALSIFVQQHNVERIFIVCSHGLPSFNLLVFISNYTILTRILFLDFYSLMLQLVFFIPFSYTNARKKGFLLPEKPLKPSTIGREFLWGWLKSFEWRDLNRENKCRGSKISPPNKPLSLYGKPYIYIHSVLTNCKQRMLLADCKKTR